MLVSLYLKVMNIPEGKWLQMKVQKVHGEQLIIINFFLAICKILIFG